jgi:hypothetical protein
MTAKCAPLETVVLNREIRRRIGRRLREHHDLAQRIPLPARFAELAEQFGQPIEPDESEPEGPTFLNPFHRRSTKKNEFGQRQPREADISPPPRYKFKGRRGYGKVISPT